MHGPVPRVWRHKFLFLMCICNYILLSGSAMLTWSSAALGNTIVQIYFWHMVCRFSRQKPILLKKFTYIRVALSIILSKYFWPYARSCDIGVFHGTSIILSLEISSVLFLSIFHAHVGQNLIFLNPTLLCTMDFSEGNLYFQIIDILHLPPVVQTGYYGVRGFNSHIYLEA